MKNNIVIEQLNFNRQHIILDIIHQDSALKETFGGKKNTSSRILNSSYVGLIKKDNLTIGFIMLVYNQKNTVHEIDMGIIREYRNKGYGTMALNQLNIIIKQKNIDISIQIKKDNLSAIKTVFKNNFVLSKEDHQYFYYQNINKRKIK